MKLNTNKYTNAILFFIEHCNNMYLGATKLNKLLYYLDFISFRDRGTSVTGDVYVHKDYGPVPAYIDSLLEEMKEAKIISIERVPYGENGTFKYEAKKNTELGVFNKEEVKLLNNICKEFELWSTDKIVNQTHLEAPWFYSKPFEVVDYSYSKDIDFFTKDRD